MIKLRGLLLAAGIAGVPWADGAANPALEGAVFAGANAMIEQVGTGPCPATGSVLWRVHIRGTELRFKWTYHRDRDAALAEGSEILALAADGTFGRVVPRDGGTSTSTGLLGSKGGYFEVLYRRGDFVCRQRTDLVRIQATETRKNELMRALITEANMLTGMNDLINAFAPAILADIRRRVPTLTDDAARAMSEEIIVEFRLSIGEFVEIMSAIFDRYYTEEDLEALIAFYRTPTGRKMAGLTARLALESQAAGMRWGQAVGQRGHDRAVRKARELGYNL